MEWNFKWNGSLNGSSLRKISCLDRTLSIRSLDRKLVMGQRPQLSLARPEALQVLQR